MSPLVGIALSLDLGDLRSGRPTHYLDTAYAAAVGEAGGTPLYLPSALPSDAPEAGIARVAPLLDRLDGLLLPGGDDFPPPEPAPAGLGLAPAPPEQLAFDAALLAAARARGLPVFGICYGMQLMARESGGRLHHHLPSERPGGLDHKPADAGAGHDLELEPGSRLAALLGPGPGRVNSRHHQGVAEAGPGLRVVARAPDGVIEAIEAPEGAFLLGVQWHPESMDAGHRARIFGGFLAACRERAEAGR